MAFYDDYDPYSDPAMAQYVDDEDDRRTRRSQKQQWEEDRTLRDYIAATPKGERRFTNIPGGDEDTFLMKEAPLQAPLGMDNAMRASAQYGADPYKLTQEEAERIQSEGGTPDVEKIYTDVRDRLRRQDVEARGQFGLQQAAFLKHGPGKQPKPPDLDGTITALINAGEFDRADALMAQFYGIGTGREPIEPPDLQALVDIETKGEGFKAVERAVKKEEGKRKDRARTERFMSRGRGEKSRSSRRTRSRWPYDSNLFEYRYGEYSP